MPEGVQENEAYLQGRVPLRIVLLYTSAATTHMTSRAGGSAEYAAAVMHLLTPALRPDPRSSGGLYI